MKSVVFEINGIQIGVIGYLTPETKIIALRNNVDYIEEVIAIREEVQKLKEKGVTILIALGHSGFKKDLQIAKEVEDIDLVIGGHTHTFLWNGANPDIEEAESSYPTIVKQDSGRNVFVVQAYAYSKYLGTLNLIFDSAGEIIHFDGNPILLDNRIAQDPDVAAIVKQYREDVSKLSEGIVGNTQVFLDGQSCRLLECNLGNLITDAVVHKYASEYKGDGWTDSPLAVLQGGGIRASINYKNSSSEITKGDLMAVMPFYGHLVKLTINGSIIWEMFEHSVALYSKTSPPGQFLQVSGLKIEYDFKKRAGHRVVNIQIRCGKCEMPVYSPINESATYGMLTSSFLQMGGDGFSMLKSLNAEDLYYNELEATTEYIQKSSPIHPSIEDRIIIRNIDKLAIFANIKSIGDVDGLHNPNM